MLRAENSQSVDHLIFFSYRLQNSNRVWNQHHYFEQASGEPASSLRSCNVFGVTVAVYMYLLACMQNRVVTRRTFAVFRSVFGCNVISTIKLTIFDNLVLICCTSADTKICITCSKHCRGKLYAMSPSVVSSGEIVNLSKKAFYICFVCKCICQV